MAFITTTTIQSALHLDPTKWGAHLTCPSASSSRMGANLLLAAAPSPPPPLDGDGGPEVAAELEAVGLCRRSHVFHPAADLTAFPCGAIRMPPFGGELLTATSPCVASAIASVT